MRDRTRPLAAQPIGNIFLHGGGPQVGISGTGDRRGVNRLRDKDVGHSNATGGKHLVAPPLQLDHQVGIAKVNRRLPSEYMGWDDAGDEGRAMASGSILVGSTSFSFPQACWKTMLATQEPYRIDDHGVIGDNPGSRIRFSPSHPATTTTAAGPSKHNTASNLGYQGKRP